MTGSTDPYVQDQPGINTDLRPERAPRWMRRLVDDVPMARSHRDIRGVDARGLTNPRADGRSAAVLMLMSGTGSLSDTLPGDATILLTHRTPTMRSHSGQIAFPGGRIDPDDVNAVDAALREAWEETGLDRTTVTPVAALEPVHIRASGYPVHPVLAHRHSPSRVGVASPAETDDVFHARIHDLIDPRNRLMVGWSGWSGPAFTSHGYLVWGFTAGLISALIHQSGWEQPWDRDTTLDLSATLEKSRNNEPQLNQIRFLR